MNEESKFVTHSQLHKRDLELYKYVDNSYKELEKFYYKLDKKIELDSQKSEQTIKQQDKMIEGIDKINDNFIKFDKRVSKIEDETVKNTGLIEKIQKNNKEKKDGVVNIVVAIITATAMIVSAAFGFAQVFF